MSVEAMVRVQVDLWELCSVALSKRLKAPIPIEAKMAVFNSVHTWQITHYIDKQRETQFQQRQERAEEPPSDKQISYAKDLGIVIPEGCTKKELSKLINAKA